MPPVNKHQFLLSACAVSLLVHGVVLTAWHWSPAVTVDNQTTGQPVIQLIIDTTAPAATPPSQQTESILPVQQNQQTAAQRIRNASSEPATKTAATMTAGQPVPAKPPVARTSPSIPDANTLRRLAFSQVKLPNSELSETSRPPAGQARLPGNWSDDALTVPTRQRTNLLEPLMYSGSATSDTWREPNGQLQRRHTLADGRIICSSAVTVGLDPQFSETIMQHSDCGKITGNRQNTNKLAKYRDN